VHKKPLEDVLSNLRNQSLNFYDQSQSVRPVVREKHKEWGKQYGHLQEVYEVDFKNKRNGRIPSRMIINRHKRRNDPIQTIMIDDKNSV